MKPWKTTFGVDPTTGKVVETTGQVKEIEKKRFHIGGQSGFKWLKKSPSKAWISGDKIYKRKQDRKLS